MTFLISLVLVALAGAFALFALLADASAMFVLSAACSAGAVILIWRRTAADRETIILTDAPDRSDADWFRPMKGDHDSEEEAPDELEDAKSLGIARYDELLAAEVLPRLETLSVEELRAVIAREKRGLNREAIMRRAERLIELTLHGGVDVRPEPLGVTREKDRGLRRGPDLSL